MAVPSFAGSRLVGRKIHRARWGREGRREKARVGNLVAGLLIGLALVFDGVQGFFSFIQAIPFIGIPFVVVTTFTGIVAFLVLGIGFALCGVNYFTGRKAGTKLLALFGSFVISFVPLLNMVPEITGFAITMVIASRIEDFVGNKKHLEKIKTHQEKQLSQAKNERVRAQIMARQQEQNNHMIAQIVEGRSNPKNVASPKEKGAFADRSFEPKLAPDAPFSPKTRPGPRRPAPVEAANDNEASGVTHIDLDDIASYDDQDRFAA